MFTLYMAGWLAMLYLVRLILGDHVIPIPPNPKIADLVEVLEALTLLAWPLMMIVRTVRKQWRSND